MIRFGGNLVRMLSHVGEHTFVKHCVRFQMSPGAARWKTSSNPSVIVVSASGAGMALGIVTGSVSATLGSGADWLHEAPNCLALYPVHVGICRQRMQNDGRLSNSLALQHQFHDFTAGVRSEFEDRVPRNRRICQQRRQQNGPQVGRGNHVMQHFFRSSGIAGRSSRSRLVPSCQRELRLLAKHFVVQRQMNQDFDHLLRRHGQRSLGCGLHQVRRHRRHAN